jgi:hypothetical protein
VTARIKLPIIILLLHRVILINVMFLCDASGQDCLNCLAVPLPIEKKGNTTPPSRLALIGIEPYLIFNSSTLILAEQQGRRDSPITIYLSNWIRHLPRLSEIEAQSITFSANSGKKTARWPPTHLAHTLLQNSLVIVHNVHNVINK